MEKITREEIKQKLLKYYCKNYNGCIDREMSETIISPDGNEFRVFSLVGSPCKGYAIYVEGHGIIKFFGPHLETISKKENIYID